MKKAIKVKNLTKNFKIEVKKSWFKNRIKSLFKPEYKTFKAVDNINFEVKTWEKVAFLWPNWAWKSTTIKMLTWILERTSGELSVLWIDPSKDRKKLVYKIWAVFGQISRLWYHLIPKDTFTLFWKIFDIPDEKFKERLNYLTKEFEIEKFIELPVRKLSLGQRMRCEVVASLLHSPEVIFLDEPTIGLDMVAKEKLREVINKINKEENTTILLTSHDIWDIEKICDRVIIINYGRILYDGSLEKLKKKHVETHKKVVEADIEAIILNSINFHQIKLSFSLS